MPLTAQRVDKRRAEMLFGEAEIRRVSGPPGVDHTADLVLSSLKQVLDAYASRDVQATLAVWRGDEAVNALCTSLFRELLTYVMEDPRSIIFCMQLMFCAKDIERIRGGRLLHDRGPRAHRSTP